MLNNILDYQHILKQCKTLTIKEVLCRLLEFKEEGLYSHIKSLNFDINAQTNSFCNKQLLKSIHDIVSSYIRSKGINGDVFLEILRNRPNIKIEEHDNLQSVVKKYYLETVCDDLSSFVESDNFYNYLLELITGRDISTFTDDELEQGGDKL